MAFLFSTCNLALERLFYAYGQEICILFLLYILRIQWAVPTPQASSVGRID